MRCPFATWIGSPNYGYPQGTHGQNHPVAIVDHVMAGTLPGCDEWFSHTPPWSSAHFGIGKGGAIHQYVDTDDGPYANGALNKPSTAGLEIAEFGNPNVLTVSIEHEGWPGEEWPDAMYQASLRLKRWLVSNVTTGMWRLLGHCDFDSVDRRNCPGPTWPKARLLADLEDDMTQAEVDALKRRIEILEEAQATAADCRDWTDVMGTSAEDIMFKAFIDKRIAWRLRGKPGWTVPA